MPTPNVTPFIPPLHTPEAQHPPPVPSPGGPLAGWASLPQNPNNYPAFGTYPSTPYVNSPYIPHLSAHNTPVIPTGSYTPAGGPLNVPPVLPNGLSADYVGYPQMAPTPASAWAGGMNLPPGGPPVGWPGPASAPVQAPPGTPWHGGGGGGGYPAFQQPMSAAFPGMAGGPPGMMGGGPPPMMAGGMPPMGGMAPPPLGRPQGWGAPPVIPPMPGGYPHTPGMGGGYPMPMDPYGPPPAWAHAAAPAAAPLSRAAGQVGDRMDRFATGEHYGPVLEPFLVKVVKADVQVNALLGPQPDDDKAAYLKWNMLFPSQYCQRSTDPVTVSWMQDRGAPATFPRVTSMRILSKSIPWMITVRARNRVIGVTCGEVIDAIAENMGRHTSEVDYKALSKPMQRQVAENYRRHRSRAHGVPGGALGEGMKRLDWLGQDSMFGGVERNDRYVKEVCGDVLPCTFVLSCIKRYQMTEQEIREHEARARSLQSHARSVGSPSSRSTTTMTDESDEDD
ncbi:hypothetical protein HGRIS_013761 [Hohenbuehelia grisea]|uniref:DUF6699 domain-containing protein n=1 Tax=Hohenbuehelia grisea TaxID=104357 RepID=A0ABR3IWM2_9AGAR